MRIQPRRTLIALGFSIAFLPIAFLPSAVGSVVRSDDPVDRLVARIDRITAPILDGDHRFDLRIQAWVADRSDLSWGGFGDADLRAANPGGVRSVSIAALVRLQRMGAHEFRLRVEGRWANLLLSRSPDQTLLSTISEKSAAYHA